MTHFDRYKLDINMLNGNSFDVTTDVVRSTTHTTIELN